jgi:hypothetical protein
MKEYHLPKDRVCKHEFVLSDAGFPNHVTTNDISNAYWISACTLPLSTSPSSWKGPSCSSHGD